MSVFPHLRGMPADDSTPADALPRQPRNHAVLCNQCFQYTTYSYTSVCYLCVPLDMPNRATRGDAA